MSDGSKNKASNRTFTILEKVVFALVLSIAGYAFYSAAMVLLDVV